MALASPTSSVPDTRIRVLNDHPSRFQAEGDYVLYWMISARRTGYNFGLERAVDWAVELKKPLLVFEPLRASYPWNCDRFHAFAMQGMADNARNLARYPVSYFPYLEPEVGAERGLLKELARRACLVISDDFPCFFLPRMVEVAARILGIRFEVIDSNGLYPMRDTERAFTRAFDFRRHLQKSLPLHLKNSPKPDPLAGRKLERMKELPPEILKRWQPADPVAMTSDAASLQEALEKLPINHQVKAVDAIGGSMTANRLLEDFIHSKLPHYAAQRNEPERQTTSGFSPYLHFGHLSAHQVFESLAHHVHWSPEMVAAKPTGQSAGWWGAPAEVEAFWDQLITWRELGYNMCANAESYDQFESLPTWAQQTLTEHQTDHRPHRYSLEQFEQGLTHDELWNAAQYQLVLTGTMQNYLRMLWGKKILEWSPNPRSALATMIELNNKWALDGRNPNSYSGIFWVLGRYDRAWNEREIFGKIRYMSSDNTARKFKVKNYIRRFTPPRNGELF
jgi:deoxyribodipyrimidine photo-lyase